jgi:hypothetical protein
LARTAKQTARAMRSFGRGIRRAITESTTASAPDMELELEVDENQNDSPQKGTTLSGDPVSDSLAECVIEECTTIIKPSVARHQPLVGADGHIARGRYNSLAVAVVTTLVEPEVEYDWTRLSVTSNASVPQTAAALYQNCPAYVRQHLIQMLLRCGSPMALHRIQQPPLVLNRAYWYQYVMAVRTLSE